MAPVPRVMNKSAPRAHSETQEVGMGVGCRRCASQTRSCLGSQNLPSLLLRQEGAEKQGGAVGLCPTSSVGHRRGAEHPAVPSCSAVPPGAQSELQDSVACASPDCGAGSCGGVRGAPAARQRQNSLRLSRGMFHRAPRHRPLPARAAASARGCCCFQRRLLGSTLPATSDPSEGRIQNENTWGLLRSWMVAGEQLGTARCPACP